MVDGHDICREARNKTGHISMVSVGRDRGYFTHPRKPATLDRSSPDAGMQCCPQRELSVPSTSTIASRIKMAGQVPACILGHGAT
jgi:hypothetical protein